MIVFTGGGSGGHAIVASTLIKAIQKEYPNQKLAYVGSSKGIEAQIAKDLNIDYFSISTGKLRRYFSLQNFLDCFKVCYGFLQSLGLLLSSLKKTKIIFSTGGFVSVPICLAGFLFRKRIYLHEQTTRLGLANKIISKLCDKIFISFEESFKFLPKEKTILSGYPLRESILNQNFNYEVVKGLTLQTLKKPLLFVTGGGNGAKLINDLILKHLPELKEEFIIFHQVGKKFISDFISLEDDSYKVFGFIGDEFVDIVKNADVIISRAGAGSVSEFMALDKKVIFIPLKIAQRNEQYHNAVESQKYIHSKIVLEDSINDLDLLKLLKTINLDKKKNEAFYYKNASETILKEVFS